MERDEAKQYLEKRGYKINTMTEIQIEELIRNIYELRDRIEQMPGDKVLKAMYGKTEKDIEALSAL
jgi:hypothetical protein